MMRIYDFKCRACNTSVEKLIHASQLTLLCVCGGEMKRLVSTPTIQLDGTDPAFPSAYDQWANTREQNARIRAKRNN